MPPIKVLVPDMPSVRDLQPLLLRIDQYLWYTNFGPLVRELEASLSAVHAAADGALPNVCTVSNATVGLELALRAQKLPAGAAVLVPGITFPATIAATLHAGLTPVVCDVDADSWLLTPAIARRALAARGFAAVMPVTTYGAPLDAAAWDDFVAETRVPVIMDAAGAFGNQKIGRRTTVVLSLHATKTLGAGEGGAVISFEPVVTAQVAKDSNFGIDTRTGYVSSLGTNAKLSEYHAAVALAALARRETRGRVRMDLHQRYSAALHARCPALVQQQRPVRGVYSILSVLLPPGHRAEQAVAHFAARGIETRRWYWPTVREHPAFRELAAADDLATVRAMGERVIGVPFHPFLSPEDVNAVVAAFEAYPGAGQISSRA